MTNQEIFNKVVSHLRAQGIKSKDATGCLYRGPNGTKCAAGCLIEDSEYDPEMERQKIDKLLNNLKRNHPLLRLSDNLPIIYGLQWTHDEMSVEEWEEQFKIIAKTFHLEYHAS